MKAPPLERPAGPGSSPPEEDTPFARQLTGVIFSRLCLNTARRFCYPFAPAISRGLGAPLTLVTSIIALNQVTALFGFLIGPVADRYGYRFMMLLGLVFLAVGMGVAALWPLVGAFSLALFLSGIGKAIFDPVTQAFIADRVPYHRRGLAIGISETAWAMSSLLGIPLMGLLIQRYSWRTPFWVLAAAAAVGALYLALSIPRPGTSIRDRRTRSGNGWDRLISSRPAMGALGFGAMLGVAADNLFIVYGMWFEETFHLQVAALGFTAVVIGVAELFGEALTAAVSDRLGPIRALTIGTALSGLSYLLLPLSGAGLFLALPALFIVFVTFEFTMVTTFTFCTEILPDARATMMAGYYSAASLGRMTGGIVGGAAWAWGGIALVAALSCGATFIGLACMRWGLAGRRS